MQAVITRTSHRKPSWQNNFVVANELSLQNSLVTKYEKSSRNLMISRVFWICYPDLNWGPHPYQGIFDIFITISAYF